MTQTAAYDANALDEPAGAGPSGWLREITVHASMLIVIAALGMALRASFGFGATAAIIAALTVYWGLLVVHALVRRGQVAAELSAEVAHLTDENEFLRRRVGAHRAAEIEREPPRLAGLVGERPPPRILAGNAGAPRPRVPEAAKPAPTAPPAKPAARAGEGSAQTAAKVKPDAAPSAPAAPKPPATAAPTRHAVMTRGGREETARDNKPPPAAASTRAAPPPLPTRPRPQGLAALAVDRPPVHPPVVEASPEIAEAEDPRAADVAIMQSLIKGLADQLNGAPAKPAPAQKAVVAPPASPQPSELDTIEEQVGALRGMADAMRAPPSGHGSGIEGDIARAIDAARVDVYVDPILGLDDRRARHFEVSVRLRREDGEILDPRAFAGVLAGTGLSPRIEALTFTESIRLAGEFAARGAAADLFSTASGDSLRDGGFHTALRGALAPDATLGARLVMSIGQAEVRAFGPAHWDALEALSRAGLRYALVDVVDLDMDFEALALRGFEFVRLDAQVFLQGLPAPHGFVPAADLCRHLSGLGFTLIVSRIAEERELVKVLGFGALLGQGRLFGGPRPIRQDRGTHRPSAA